MRARRMVRWLGFVVPTSVLIHIARSGRVATVVIWVVAVAVFGVSLVWDRR